MTLVNLSSYELTETTDTGSKGTIEVTLRGRTQRLPATKVDKYGWTFVYGLTGRYLSGTKAWPATITVSERGESVNFGRDDRHHKFNKANCLFFAETK